MIRTLLFVLSVSVFSSSIVAASSDLTIPFPLPAGVEALSGAEIHELLSGKCIAAVEGAYDFEECFEVPEKIGDSATLYGRSQGQWLYEQPSDWRVESDFLCYRVVYFGRVDMCRVIAIDEEGYIVAYNLNEERERDWENGLWRAKIVDVWALFR